MASKLVKIGGELESIAEGGIVVDSKRVRVGKTDNDTLDKVLLGVESSSVGKKGTGTGAEIFNNYDTNKAEGSYSHAEGSSTTASGTYSHTEGVGTKALKEASHAEGNNSSAAGLASHAEGQHTITTNEGEHAEGKYNVSRTGKTISSIGIGTSNDLRKNAVEVTADGKIFIDKVGGYNTDGNNETALPLQHILDIIDSDTETWVNAKFSTANTPNSIKVTLNRSLKTGGGHSPLSFEIPSFDGTNNPQGSGPKLLDQTSYEELHTAIEQSIVNEENIAALQAANSNIDAKIKELIERNDGLLYEEAKLAIDLETSVVFKADEGGIKKNTVKYTVNVKGALNPEYITIRLRSFLDESQTSGNVNMTKTKVNSFTGTVEIKEQTTLVAYLEYLNPATGKKLAHKEVSVIVHAVFPLYVGNGKTQDNVLHVDEFRQEPKSTPQGKYVLKNIADKDYIFICVPDGMAFDVDDVIISSSRFGIPFDQPTSLNVDFPKAGSIVTGDNKTQHGYKIYKSSNPLKPASELRITIKHDEFSNLVYGVGDNNKLYIPGIGGYDGTNQSQSQDVASVISDLNAKLSKAAFTTQV